MYTLYLYNWLVSYKLALHKLEYTMNLYKITQLDEAGPRIKNKSLRKSCSYTKMSGKKKLFWYNFLIDLLLVQ